MILDVAQGLLLRFHRYEVPKCARSLLSKAGLCVPYLDDSARQSIYSDASEIRSKSEDELNLNNE